MKITSSIHGLRNFQAWEGARHTLDKVEAADMLDELEEVLEDIYPDGIDEMELNDLLWFDPEWIYETLGLNSDGEVVAEPDELEEAA